MGRKPAHWTRVDRDYERIRIDMQKLFNDLAIETPRSRSRIRHKRAIPDHRQIPSEVDRQASELMKGSLDSSACESAWQEALSVGKGDGWMLPLEKRVSQVRVLPGAREF